MAIDPDLRRTRARQVGLLMQAYRRAHVPNGGRRGLSQEGLLDLMGQVDHSYLNRYDRSTVSRWESGATLPTKERLEVFGRALDLSPDEVDGLLSLAGLDTYATVGPIAEIQTTPGPSDISDIEEAPTADAPDPAGGGDVAEDSGGTYTSSHTRFAMRYVWSRFALPGSVVALAGYFTATLGWDSPLMLAIYVGGALCGLTAQGLWRLRRSDDIGDLLFVTVFFLLSVYLLQAPLTYLDTYGLYSIGSLAGTSIPFTLSLIMNLFVATMAGLMFVRLRIWQHSSRSGEKSIYGRAAWIVLPPVAFVYAFILLFANIGLWIAGLGLFTLLAGIVAALLVLRDRDGSIGEWDRKFLICITVAVVTILATLGVVAILVSFSHPSSYPDTALALFYSWEKDFDALGYPADEYHERSRLSTAWASLITLAYMVIVVGGKLIVTTYRLDGGDSAMPSAAAVVTDRTQPQRPLRLTRNDLRHWAGCVVGLRIFGRRSGRTRFLSS